MTHDQLLDITISNDPLTGLRRVTEAVEWGQKDKEKYLYQVFHVFLLDANGERILDTDSRKNTYEVKFLASNNWRVDPATGASIGTVEELQAELQEGEELPGVGQWDFFIMVSNSPVDVNQFRYNLAMEADSRGKFNV